MLRASASTQRARPPIEPEALPASLWILRNKLTGRWIMAHQESTVVHKQIILSLTSEEAVESMVKFLAKFALIEAEVHRLI